MSELPRRNVGFIKVAYHTNLIYTLIMADEYEPNPFSGYEIIKRGQTPGMTKMAKCYTCGAQFHGPTSALREVPTDDGWSTYLPCPTQRCSGRGVFY